MFKKFLLLGVILLMSFMPGLSFAQSTTERDRQSLLSAFMAYTDLRIDSVKKSIEILASTKEARSGRWNKMKNLLGGYERSEEGLIVWFARPDGTYDTVDRGLMDKNLAGRSYFPGLMLGRDVVGALVISKSTGQRSAVIAVSIKKGGRVIGAVGASLFLDKLAKQVSSVLDLPPNVSFFALAPDGLTTLHSRTDRDFLDPRDMGSETLKDAANKMLSTDSGEVTYEFDNATKKAIYRTSPLTQWRFVITTSVPLKK